MWDLLEWLTHCGPTLPTTILLKENSPNNSNYYNNNYSPKGKFKNLVVVRSTRLDVCRVPHHPPPPVFSICQNPDEVGSNASKEMNSPVRVRARARLTASIPFPHVLYVGSC